MIANNGLNGNNENIILREFHRIHQKRFKRVSKHEEMKIKNKSVKLKARLQLIGGNSN